MLEDLPRTETIEVAKTIRKKRRLNSPNQSEPTTSSVGEVAMTWDDLQIIQVPSPCAFVTCSPATSSTVGSAPQSPRQPHRVARRLIPSLPPEQHPATLAAVAGPSSSKAHSPPLPERRPATQMAVAGPSSPRARSPPLPERRPATPAAVAGPSSPRARSPPLPEWRPATPAAVAGPSSPRARSPPVPERRPATSQWRPLREMDIEEALFGEDDDSEEEEEEMGAVILPRVRQLIFEDDDEDAGSSVPAYINMNWEPMRPNVDEPGGLEPTNSEPIGPEKFAFKWRSFRAAALESPLNRREEFLDGGCGPTQPAVSPYDAFTQIWDRQIVEHIVTETNKYAQQCAENMMREGTLRPNSRITRWKDTTIDEIYRLFAILLAMGMVVKSRIIDYWSNEECVTETPGFQKVIALNRFKLLIKFLHFADSSNVLPSKFFRIQPILDHLNNKFQSLYVPNRNLALDESLTLYKGWLNIKQYINNKAAGVGVKTYEVCESATGYLYRFEVHAGSHEAASTGPLSGFVPSLVLRLLDGLENKGHTVWMDNFYNSPVLARELKTRGFDCVGTLRPNRQFVPIELANLNVTDMAAGEVRGCTSGDVDIIVWRDKKKVCLISTYHGLATVKDNRTHILKPNVVPDYNVCMGGVDSKDQMLAAYSIERTRQRIWYKKLFRRLLNASALNSFIIFKHHSPITHRRFRLDLIKSIFTIHNAPRPRTLHPAPSAIQPLCLPARYDAGSSGTQRVRRICKICRSSKKIDTFCKRCNISYCIFTQCWEQHLLNS